MVDSSITFDELLLSEDDFITQGPLLVILEDEEVAAPHLDIIDMIDIIDIIDTMSQPHLVLLQQRLALHLHLQQRQIRQFRYFNFKTMNVWKFKCFEIV